VCILLDAHLGFYPVIGQHPIDCCESNVIRPITMSKRKNGKPIEQYVYHQQCVQDHDAIFRTCILYYVHPQTVIQCKTHRTVCSSSTMGARQSPHMENMYFYYVHPQTR
jgi:hypothetical protein